MNSNFGHSVLACVIAGALAGCGGGSDSGGAAAPAALTLSGTAASGAALANAPVSAKCGTGTGTATTGADGSYTITITGGSLPCVLVVAPAGGTALHSVIDGSGAGSVTVNITPLTELVAASLAGGAPSDLYANFDAAAQAKVSPSAVTAAIAALVGTLQGVVDLSGVNPIKDALVAANGTTAGNALDQKLDALQAALAAAQTTLAEVTTAVAASGTSTAAAQTILQPATPSCAGFRSGKYRVINPHEVGHDAAYVTHLITVDAVAQTVTDDLDPTHTPTALTAVAGSPCKFTLPGDFGTTTALVSRSGLAVVHSVSSTGQTQTSLVVPEQGLGLADLAGTWNFLEYSRTSPTTAFAPASGYATLDAAGGQSDAFDCTGLDTCTAISPQANSFTVNSAGGFNSQFGSGRAFAFRTASGSMSMFIIDTATGSILVANKQSTLALPAVGDVTTFFDFTVGGNGVASALSDVTETVRTVDATAGSYTRERASDGRIDGFAINTPRAGMRYRAAGTSPVNGGGTVNYSAILTLPLIDAGITVYTSVAANQNFFGVSIGHP